MHSSYKALEEAVTPLAERLFDQIPIIRRTVTQVAAHLLLEYRDRYSFFHKLLPLVLTRYQISVGIFAVIVVTA